jgi:hypothetical protein
MLVRRTTYRDLQALYRREVDARQEAEEDLAKAVAGAATVSRELNAAHLEIRRLRERLAAEDISLPEPAVCGDPLTDSADVGRPPSLITLLHREREARARQEKQLLEAQKRLQQMDVFMSWLGSKGYPVERFLGTSEVGKPADSDTPVQAAVREPGVAAC